MEKLDEVPPFFDSLHESYITSLAAKLDVPSSYEGAVTEHLRMSGVYWSITALSLICTPDEVDKKMGLTDLIVDWVFQCYDSVTGSFGGNIGHDGHMLYTLSAVQILALADRLSDPRLQVEQILKFVSSMQQPDGSFSGDAWGEVDTRFSYCAISCLSLLGALPSLRGGNEEQQNIIDLDKAVNYIASCRNFDGGFGCVPGAESHAGQIFCCVGALAIAGALHLLDDDLLCWWLAERQCDSGGLNGRPEKQADVCYSWWILSALSIMGRVQWINTKKLKTFILQCQDDVGKRFYYTHTFFCAKTPFCERNDSHNIIIFFILTSLGKSFEKDGGIADRPHDMADVFHTFFGISGLSLLGYFKEEGSQSKRVYRDIDPLYALPVDVVQRLALKGQVISQTSTPLDERLVTYDVLTRQRKLNTEKTCSLHGLT